MKILTLSLIATLLGSAQLWAEDWTIDSAEDWTKNIQFAKGAIIAEGSVSPKAMTATISTKVYSSNVKRSASSLVVSQSPIWQNWNPIENLGPANLADAPVLLTLGPDNYWMFGRYGGQPRPKKGQNSKGPTPFKAEETTLEGFDIPLLTTRYPHQFDAPGGLKPGKGGYHAWQSRDMKNWVHHGPVTEGFSRWVTSAEWVDGKALIYFDFPNDQDPHVYVDDNLFDGQPGKNMGMAVRDPSHGSDAGFIRDLDGNMHVILEDWSPISANKRSWDSPLAAHAVSPNGIDGFKFRKPPIDNRTKPTGKIATYKHPHWAKEDPKNYKTSIAEYEVHEPEQEAYGDWAPICIGGQYYLFGDYDPIGGHEMSVGWFTSSSIDKEFTWCDKIGKGHPDPDIAFAEGQFYLATQQKTDYVSPGPWVETVVARVGVDVDKDGKIDQWTDWTELKETYDYIPGFSKQIKSIPAELDLSGLPSGYGFQIQLRVTDSTKNKSKPIIERLKLSFTGPDAVGRVSSSEKALILPYDGSWESLQQMPVPKWFDDGKIGIFIHWGPYSAIGYKKGGRGYAEHVPKLLYEDAEHYYPYMNERWDATPPEFGYKDIFPEFKADRWEPEEWAKLFAHVGARYVVLTAEHHDGWANWDSDLTPWNAVDMGPKRDIVGDLAKSVRQRGLKFAPSYHRERHPGFFAKTKYAVHSEPRPDIAEEIRRVPKAASLYGPFSYDKEFVDDYVARWKEIQAKYQPDFLWVDDFPIYTRDGNQVRQGSMKPEIKYFDDQVRLMITDFMNDASARGQQVYCNNKGANRNWPDGVGCLEKDNLKLKVIGPKWQSCTTFGTSFGYLKGDTYKTVEGVIHEMIEVVSRNGNFLINIGPRADGTIPEPQVERLQAMGDWLRINGAAIYGSRYWKVSEQKNEHLVFTTKGQNLYAIKLTKPSTSFSISGTAGWEAEAVKSVRLLGSDAVVDWTMTPHGLKIAPPSNLGRSQHAWAFEIVTGHEQHTPNVVERDASKALKGTKKVNLDGHDSLAVSNVSGSSVLIETADNAEGFKQLVPPKGVGKVKTNRATNGDLIETLTDGKLAKAIGPVFPNGVRNGAYKMDLGTTRPVLGITSWSHNWKGIRGVQKIVLYGSALATDPGWDLKNYAPLGTIDTTSQSKASFTAASLRASTGKSLGKFRWIVWAVSPAIRNGIAENTAFQELSVDAGEAIPK